MDRRRIDNEPDIIRDIGGALPILYDSALLDQMLCQITFLRVGTADAKTAVHSDLSKTAHADAADPDKMDIDWFIKIDLIHNDTSY